eukprot:m.113201 g.113201  ORF g.113201 m.113201 type:complete len:258 (+) comp14123_c0_seq2:39-812(+)
MFGYSSSILKAVGVGLPNNKASARFLDNSYNYPHAFTTSDKSPVLNLPSSCRLHSCTSAYYDRHKKHKRGKRGTFAPGQQGRKQENYAPGAIGNKENKGTHNKRPWQDTDKNFQKSYEWASISSSKGQQMKIGDTSDLGPTSYVSGIMISKRMDMLERPLLKSDGPVKPYVEKYPSAASIRPSPKKDKNFITFASIFLAAVGATMLFLWWHEDEKLRQRVYNLPLIRDLMKDIRKFQVMAPPLVLPEEDDDKNKTSS